MKNLLRLALPVCLTAAVAASCEFVSYTPYDTSVPSEYTNLTQRNIERLMAESGDRDELRIAVIGDPQRQLDSSADFVAQINSRDDVDLVVVAGDLTEYGLRREYVAFAEVYDELDVPYLTVIGNHDFLGKGEFAYDTMFGELNYTLDIAGSRLVFLNSVGVHTEDPGLDLNWLERAVAPSETFDQAIVITHVPVESGWIAVEKEDDRIVEETSRRFIETMVDSGTVSLSIHGHWHKFEESDLSDDLHTILVDNPDDRNFLYLTVTADGYTTERVFY